MMRPLGMVFKINQAKSQISKNKFQNHNLKKPHCSEYLKFVNCFLFGTCDLRFVIGSFVLVLFFRKTKRNRLLLRHHFGKIFIKIRNGFDAFVEIEEREVFVG